jgi:hypothetical protein
MRQESRPLHLTQLTHQLGWSEIEVQDQLAAHPLRELGNLDKGLLAFGVLCDSRLRSL